MASSRFASRHLGSGGGGSGGQVVFFAASKLLAVSKKGQGGHDVFVFFGVCVCVCWQVVFLWFRARQGCSYCSQCNKII